MADVSDPSELFVLELHEDENTRDSDDDKIELDDVSTPIKQWNISSIHSSIFRRGFVLFPSFFTSPHSRVQDQENMLLDFVNSMLRI